MRREVAVQLIKARMNTREVVEAIAHFYPKIDLCRITKPGDQEAWRTLHFLPGPVGAKGIWPYCGAPLAARSGREELMQFVCAERCTQVPQVSDMFELGQVPPKHRDMNYGVDPASAGQAVTTHNLHFSRASSFRDWVPPIKRSGLIRLHASGIRAWFRIRSISTT